jgi:hypothetical protein
MYKIWDVKHAKIFLISTLVIRIICANLKTAPRTVIFYETLTLHMTLKLLLNYDKAHRHKEEKYGRVHTHTHVHC